MSWNSSIIAGSDLSDLSFVLPYWQAADERHRARCTDLATIGIPAPAVGDDVQAIHLLEFGFQTRIQAIVPAFIDSTITYEGSASALDGPIATASTLDFTTLLTAINGTGDYRRKKPREIPGAVGSIDFDDNTVTDGMKARMRPDVTYDPFTQTYPGETYTRTSGAWVWTPRAYPDDLDSTVAAPNTCAGHVLFAGDYFDGYVFTELHDLLNTMVWTAFDAHPPIVSFTYGPDDVYVVASDANGSGTGTTLALARADADTAFAAFTPTPAAESATNGLFATPYWTLLDDESGTSTYPDQAGISGGQYEYRIGNTHLTPAWRGTIARDAEVYVKVAAPPDDVAFSIPGPLTTHGTFDDNGTGVIIGEYHRIKLWSASTSSALAYTWPSSAHPNWGAAGFGYLHYTGFVIDTFNVVEKWNVAGGFEYVP